MLVLRLVTDTNIWMDLQVGEVLTRAFTLNARWLVTDLLFAELEDPAGSTLRAWGMEVHALDGEQLEDIVRLAGRYPRPSRTDLSGLVLARAVQGTVVTGDRALRHAAEQEQIEVHGTLWLMRRFTEEDVVTPEEAARALDLMLHGDRRLPLPQTKALIRKWRVG